MRIENGKKVFYDLEILKSDSDDFKIGHTKKS